MTDRRVLFGRADLDRLIDAYDTLVEELGQSDLANDQQIRQADENISDVLAQIGYYDD